MSEYLFTQEIISLKEFIKEHSKDSYDIYTNSNNNFVIFICNGKKYIYNGITKELLDKIYKEVTIYEDNKTDGQ